MSTVVCAGFKGSHLSDAILYGPHDIVKMGLKSLELSWLKNDTMRISLAAGSAGASGAWLGGMPTGSSSAVSSSTLMASLCHDLLLVPQNLEFTLGQS